ncbi:MAG: hypothetical protein ACYDA8_02420 [Deferrisomatales bacterium]
MGKDMERPELLPATKRERFAELLAIVSSAAPWIGGPVAEVIGGAATTLKINRVTQFVKDVLDHVEALHSRAAEEFVRSEDFVDILEKTAQAVADERNETKRSLFANYILNNISQTEIEYDRRLKCLNLLKQVDTRHLDLLSAFLKPPTEQELKLSMSAPSTTIERRAPHLREHLSAVIHDTNTLGLTTIRDNYMNMNMTGHGAANLQHAVTPLGKELLSFISTRE